MPAVALTRAHAASTLRGPLALALGCRQTGNWRTQFMWAARTLVVVPVLLCGCAPLATAAKQPKQWSASRLAADAILLEIAFVRLPAVNHAAYDAIWLAADEQEFPAELRSGLATNGLRVGVFGQELPGQLRELLDARPSSFESLSEGMAADLEMGGSRQRLPARAGHRSIIKASTVYPALPVLLSEDGIVRGHQLSDARCVFALKAYPQGDGRARLTLTPEIEHGESKMRFTGISEGMIIQQTSQERLVLDRLRLEAMLSPGQTLMLSTTPEIKGLGEYYFSQLISGALERRILLVRFAQTQFDDLFAAGQTAAPLATPGQ